MHADFGKGKVVSAAGKPQRQTAEIHFGAVGMKKLLVKVAPITKVEG
jgi:DNA helicase-2/ATP-dependent DNA helicase PcrA